MKNFKHLTENQLLAYNADSLSQAESIEVGRHLLKCEVCRKSLPLPTAEQFWAAIMTEWESDDFSDEEKKNDLYSFVSGFRSFFNLYSNLIWSSAALLILVVFSLIFWLNFADSPKENEVVQAIDIRSELSSENPFPLPKDVPVNGNRTSSASTNKIVVSPTPKQLKPELANIKPSPKNLTRTVEPPKKREQISETRGISAKCEEENNLEVETTSDKENFVFKWKKVPNAAKYHLYISDDEEILIDEFETDNETAFVLKKPLDPQKTYKWKIIITLENGETVAGPSNKFTVKDFQINPIKPKKVKNSNVRCSANE